MAEPRLFILLQLVVTWGWCMRFWHVRRLLIASGFCWENLQGTHVFGPWNPGTCRWFAKLGYELSIQDAEHI